jgi:hypothetical protein
MDPDAPWQGSPKAAPGKAVEAERDAASRSYVQRNGKTGTVDAKGRARRSRNCRRQPGGTRVAHQGLLRVKINPFAVPSGNGRYLRKRDVEAMSRIDVKRSSEMATDLGGVPPVRSPPITSRGLRYAETSSCRLVGSKCLRHD